MKFLTFMGLLSFINQSFAQLTTHITWTEQTSISELGIVYYNTHKDLTWDDFTAKPPEDNNGVATMTASGFGYKASVRTIDGKGELNVSVYCYFDKNKSWVKPGRNTRYILNHEQHHFDVSYIAAAIFMDKLKNASFTTGNYYLLLYLFYTECCYLMNKMQNDYDGQTKNGQLKKEQSKWNMLIDSKVHAITR